MEDLDQETQVLQEHGPATFSSTAAFTHQYEVIGSLAGLGRVRLAEEVIYPFDLGALDQRFIQKSQNLITKKTLKTVYVFSSTL